MRSLLFVPADSEKKLTKGLTCGADALIVDLEDSVALERKAFAREHAVAFLKRTMAEPHRPRLYARMNALDAAFWQADLTALVPTRLDGIMVPKPRSIEDVVAVAHEVSRLETAHGLEPDRIKLIAIVTEVPESVLAIQGYTKSLPRLEALTWGAEDLSSVLGSQSTREHDGQWTSPYLLARNLTLLAASASSRTAIDTVYVDFKNRDGLTAECAAAARDGFTAKMAIHPDQVAIINAAFTPNAADVAWAERVIQLFAARPDAGTLAMDGQMVDKPHLVRARRILAQRFRG